jgi:hypothetical protein
MLFETLLGAEGKGHLSTALQTCEWLVSNVLGEKREVRANPY